MKRFLIITLAMSFVMGSTVFAAESDWRNIRVIWVEKEESLPPEKVRPYLSWQFLGEEFFADKIEAVRMFRDGRERKLKYPLYRRYGQTLIAAEDLANAINGSFSLDEWEHKVTLSADVLRNQNEHLWVGRQSRKSIQTGSSYYIDDYKKAKAMKDSEGVWYIPLREMAESVLYDVEWKKMGDTEYFMLESHEIPQLSASARYDAERNMVSMSLNNWTQDTYLYGEEFFLQKWDGSQWKKLPRNREICYVYPADQELPGISEGDWIAASRTMEHSLVIYGDGNGLDSGNYQIYKEILQKDAEKPITYYIGAEFMVE